MDFRILGPLEVYDDRGAVEVPGTKPLAVLAFLLLHANEPVKADRIAVAVWGEDAAADAVKTVHVNVSRLRKALGGDDVLETTRAGYRLRVLPGELDADRFERLLAAGRSAIEHGRPEEARRELLEALALWRERPLAELEFEEFAQDAIAQFKEQHLASRVMLAEANLAAGRPSEAIEDLQRLVTELPTREPLACDLMLALYRCGRQVEALEAYREAHDRLTELGIEPGDQLRDLQAAILRQDRSLLLEPWDLPYELQAAVSEPLAGRASDLEVLRAEWEKARAGASRVVALAGPDGMGKTRLVAELATEVHEAGATVLYARGFRPRAVSEMLARSRRAPRPLLVVVDDADKAGDEVLAAVGDAVGAATLIVATATHHEALAALGEETVLVRHLKGLDATAVAQIAALYTPDPEVLPARLLSRSAGVPGRVHREARDWAMQRVGEVAEHAAAERSRLRSMEAELAGGVAQLQTVREWRRVDGEEHVVCPFKGLAPFEAVDAQYFFGREHLVAELVARLVGAPLLGVVGPSGSGKSSVVRAGLVPALASGVLPGSDGWSLPLMRPGEQPTTRLAATLRDVGHERFVLVVDQFEEAFTTCRDPSERAAFVSELVRIAHGGEGAVVLAMRADSYGRGAEYPALANLLAANHVLVGPMQPDELRRAVVCPAERAGLVFDRGVPDAIVEKVKDAPGALPLVSTALLQLWQKRDGRHLRLAAYKELGGVEGAVGQLADDTFKQLDPDQRERARRLLLRLVELNEEEGVERRRVPLSRLDDDLAQVLEVLADRRLVTISEGSVELAHEALAREWPQLAAWIDDNRDDLRTRRRLRTAAQEWLETKRDDHQLHGGARLAAAIEWKRRTSPDLSKLENEFLEASIEREQREERARRRAFRLVFGAVVAGLVVIAVVAAVAVDQRREADSQRDLATSRALALQSADMVEADPELAVRLALWALDTARTDQAAAALREATAAFRQRAVLRADSESANAAAYSPDGTRLVTGGNDGRALLWDAGTRDELERLDADHGPLLAARYSGDGQHIVLGFDDGSIVRTDPELREPLVVDEAGQPVVALAVSDDGRVVATALGDGTVRVVEDGSESALEAQNVLGIDVSGDGGLAATAGRDGSVRLWDLGAGGTRVLHEGGEALNDVAFSPKADVVAAVGMAGVALRWDVASGAALPPRRGTRGFLQAAAFSEDGRRLAAAGTDGAIWLWDTAGGPPVELLGQSSRLYDIGFAPGSDRVLVSAGDDGAARIWEAAPSTAFTVPGEYVWGFDLSPDGRLIATSGFDGMTRVWDASTGRREATLRGPPGEYATAKFSPDGETLVVANEGASVVRLWSFARGPDAVDRVAIHGAPTAAWLDATGDRMVYVELPGRIVVRDLRSGDEVRLRGGQRSILDARFSPDGRHVAAIGELGQVEIWRLSRPDEPERRLEGHVGHVNSLEYGRDGRIVTGGSDGTIRVWDPAAGTAVVIHGHESQVTTAAFSRDGERVLSTSWDDTLRAWDSRTGVPEATLQSSDGDLIDVAQARDGRIVTLGPGTYIRAVECEVCGSLEEVRAKALDLQPRALTATERRRFLAAAG